MLGERFLWNRGYVKNKIGGSCTFAMCGCDTDLRSDLQSQYMEIDMEWAAAECKRRPWAVPFKTRQSFVDDWVVIWNRFPHAKRGKLEAIYTSFASAALVHADRLPMYVSPAPAPKPNQACPSESNIGRWFEAHELWLFLSFQMFKCMYDVFVTQPNRVSSRSAWLVVIIFSFAKAMPRHCVCIYYILRI